MKSRTFRLSVLAALALILALGAVWAAAQTRGGARRFAGKPGTPERAAIGPVAEHIRANIQDLIALRDELALSEEQKTALREIVKSHKSEIAKTAEAIRGAKTALRGATLEPGTDEKAIRAASRDLGAAIGDAAILLSKMIEEARAVLSEEQRATLREFIETREPLADFILQRIADWGAESES